MEFRVLGPLEVSSADRPIDLRGAKRRALMALLVTRANRVTAADALIDLLWGDDSPSKASAVLQTYIYQLRKLLGGESNRVVTRAGGYTLEASDDEIDARRFERAVASVAEAESQSDISRVLRTALDLWRGPALVEFSDARWAQGEATRLEELRLSARERLFDAELALDNHMIVLPELRAVTEANPLRERFWAQLMLALYRDGRQAEALRAFQQLRTILIEELGIEPSAEVAHLERAILQHEATLQISVGREPPIPVSTVEASPELPTGVITFLLTDAENSTALWERSPSAMNDALARHDTILRETVEHAEGHLLKARGEGDSTFSVFRRTGDAVRAALEAQRRLAVAPWDDECVLKVRMAIHTGEATERDGDYYGPTVNRVARLRSLAYGGQIVLSESATAMVRDVISGDVALVDLGARQLQGLARAEHVFALVGPGLESLSQPTSVTLSQDMVDRRAELSTLEEALEQGCTGHGRLVLLTGEAGIGKTRLVQELIAQASVRNPVVLWGHCFEGEGAPPFWPWTQVLRALVVASSPGAIAAGVGPLAAEVAQLVPELAAHLGEQVAPPLLEGEAARFHLFDSVSQFLLQAARAKPLLIILEDLHWADVPSLLLLDFLTRALPSGRITILATYRDDEIPSGSPVADVLMKMARRPGTVPVDVGALGVEHVATLLKRHGWSEESQSLTAAVHARSAGNPFFVEELARVLGQPNGGDAEERLADVPKQVRAVIRSRVSLVAPEAADVLGEAAVLGEEFDLDLLEDLSDRSNDDVARIVDDAVAAQFLLEIPGGHLRYRFEHALVRDALYRDLRATDRARLHYRAAEMLEQRRNEPTGPPAAEIASHFWRSGRRGMESAARYFQLAGDTAVRARAYEQAVSCYQRALSATDRTYDTNDTARAALFVALGEAELRATNSAAGRETLHHAVEVSRGARAPVSLARAALALVLTSRLALTDRETVALLTEALEALPEDDTALRARVAARLADALYLSGDRNTVDTLVSEAIGIAQRVGDPVAQADALIARSGTMQGPHLLPDRLQLDERIIMLAREGRDLDLEAQGQAYRMIDRLRTGDIDGADDELKALTALHKQLPHRRHWRQLWGAMRALYRGDLANAEELALAALDEGQAVGDPNAFDFFAIQLGGLRREQDRSAELEFAVRTMSEQQPAIPVWRCGLVAILLDQGRREEAAVELALISKGSFQKFPLGAETLLPSLALLADASWEIGDAATALKVRERLLPYQGEVIVVGIAHDLWGAVERPLGVVTAALGDLEAASAHLERAAAFHARTGSQRWLAQTLLDQAKLAGCEGNGPRQGDLLGEARQIGKRFNISRVMRQAKQLEEAWR